MKYSEEKFSEIVKNNLHLFYEIERRDVVFRRELNAEQRRQSAPWIMMGREDFQPE